LKNISEREFPSNSVADIFEDLEMDEASDVVPGRETGEGSRFWAWLLRDRQTQIPRFARDDKLNRSMIELYATLGVNRNVSGWPHSLLKSSHFGFFDSISATRLARVHDLILFSRFARDDNSSNAGGCGLNKQ
jgi:hypothetical protein